MNLKLDWLYKLSDPVFALCISLPIILISLFVAFFVIRRATDSVRWRNRISFVAELLVIAGVVGIFAFVGRARNAILTVESVRDVKHAEYVQAVDSNRLSKSICIDSRPISPKALAAGKEACEKFGDAQRMFNLDSSLQFLARDYQRISETPGLSAEKVKLLTETAQSTWKLVKAKNFKTLHELRQREADSRISWHLILVMALLVSAGVGLKCGRAAADLWPRKR